MVRGLFCTFVLVVVSNVASVNLLRAQAGGSGLANPGRIKGVVRTMHGTPISGAVVTVSSDSFKLSVQTDLNGHYEIVELRQGAYLLSVSKDGYLGTAYGVQGAAGFPRSIDVKDGRETEANFSLMRGSVISGRILDALAEPLPGVGVVVLKRVFREGAVHTSAVANATSNDLGEFRLHGLTPGEYYVVAVPPPVQPGTERDTTYATTYYPGTTQFALAQRGRLLDEDAWVLSITMSLVATASVEGVAFDSRGQPLAGGSVSVTSTDPGPRRAFNVPISQDGTFSLQGVAPRSFALTTRNGASSGSIESALALVELAPGIQYVTLRTQPAAILFGRVISNGSVLDPRGVRIAAIPQLLIPGSRIPQARPGADGMFQMYLPTGRWRFEVVDPQGWALESVRVDALDRTGEWTAFESSGNRVELVLTNAMSQVSGTVTDGQNNLSGVPVVVFSQNSRLWSDPASRFARVQRTDRQGAFQFSLMPHGDYFITALKDFDPTQGPDPEVLSRALVRATRITLKSNERRVVTIPVAALGK